MVLQKLVAMMVLGAGLVSAHAQKLVLIDQDGTGPGESNQMAMLALLEAPEIKVLGITMVSGNGWMEESTQHTLRMLELTGHKEIPLARGATFPLVRDVREARLSAELYGKTSWFGAWGAGALPSDGPQQAATIKPKSHLPFAVPPLREGAPSIKAIDEDAVHFLIRQVHLHPHQVTIYAAGPMTNIAMALAIDPEFAGLTQGLVLMGGSLNPQTEIVEFATHPRHEFNFWFDPEAAHRVLVADWPQVDVTTVDISVKTMYTAEMLDRIKKSSTPAAKYLAAWSENRYLMWDEITSCALVDPSIITKETELYMDVDLSHGANYGDVLTWSEANKPATGVRKVHVQQDLDVPRFEKLFVDLITHER